MRLSNLINVADPNVIMTLTGIKSDGSKIGYDFKNNRWMNDASVTLNRIVAIKRFKKSNLFGKLRKCELKDFSIFRAFNFKVFKEANLNDFNSETTILSIVISINDPENYKKSYTSKNNNFFK